MNDVMMTREGVDRLLGDLGLPVDVVRAAARRAMVEQAARADGAVVSLAQHRARRHSEWSDVG